MLEVNQLSFSRNDTALFSNLSFALSAGQALHILASNGVGKTTLLKIIAGLLPVVSGEVKLTAAICYLGHKNNLHPALSPLENLRFLNPNSVGDLYNALQFINLLPQQNTLCAELSAGQLQRVSIARLYLSSAKLWLLDEPTVNLDLTSKKLLLNLCTQHLAKGGGVIMATHNLLDIQGNILQLENYV